MDLQRLLYRENNKPEALAEGDLLELLQRIAVKTENVWCLREELNNMEQDTGEPVTGFAAMLKGRPDCANTPSPALMVATSGTTSQTRW